MISLTTLLASATVAAAAKKVEDAPAPGIVDTVLGFVPSWLGGPVAQVFAALNTPIGLAQKYLVDPIIGTCPM